MTGQLLQYNANNFMNVSSYLQEFWFPDNVGFPWYDKDNNSPTHVRLETHYDNQEQKSGKFTTTKGLGLTFQWDNRNIKPQENSFKVMPDTSDILIHSMTTTDVQILMCHQFCQDVLIFMKILNFHYSHSCQTCFRCRNVTFVFVMGNRFLHIMWNRSYVTIDIILVPW